MERSQGKVAYVGDRPQLSTVSGGHSGGVTPVPIPNTEVKPASADGTWGATPWESRTSPDFSLKNPQGDSSWGFFHILEAPRGTVRMVDSPPSTAAPASGQLSEDG